MPHGGRASQPNCFVCGASAREKILAIDSVSDTLHQAVLGCAWTQAAGDPHTTSIFSVTGVASVASVAVAVAAVAGAAVPIVVVGWRGLETFC